jgi:hypothetical protein
VGRVSTRWLVEDCLELAVDELARQGLFRTPLDTRATLSWGSEHPLDISDPIEVLVELGRFCPRFTLAYEIRQDGKSFPRRHRVGLEQTWPQFGGWRWWFSCPRCGRRCDKLYLPPDAADFACRRCHGLLYLSQRLGRCARAGVRAEHLAERLGVSPEEYSCGVEPA